ncbi:hypothetical protein AEQU3_01225 [Aequorivita antarctica]|nr:hypothetical protein AEQU3_01225 [Aequorivita antarctica]
MPTEPKKKPATPAKPAKPAPKPAPKIKKKPAGGINPG